MGTSVMTSSGMRTVTSLIIALGFVQAAYGQVAKDEPATKKGDRPPALFAAGAMVGKTLYISGKGDYRPNAEFPEKVRNCLGEIRKSLQSAGLDMQHVVKSFVYLEDRDKYAEMNKYYGEFFKDAPPARTTLGVAQVPGPSRLEITCIAYSDLSGRKAIGTPRAGFPYSPGILAGETLYVSGKGDQLPDGGHPATFEEQVRQAMRNVETTLKEAGLDFRHVVMSHVFLDKYDNLEAANRVYNEFFEDGNEPACSTSLRGLDPGRFPRRGHLHRHHRPVGSQGGPSRRVEVRPLRRVRVGQSGRLGREHPVPFRDARSQARGRRRRGRARRPGPSDGSQPEHDPGGGGIAARGHRLRLRLVAGHEGLRRDERRLPALFLSRPGSPDLPDAGLRGREQRHPREGVFHRGAEPARPGEVTGASNRRRRRSRPWFDAISCGWCPPEPCWA